MANYAILGNPGHNRIYFQESKGFMVNELAVVGRALSTPVEAVEPKEIAGIFYLTFSTSSPLAQRDVALLSRLSFFYALFEVGKTGELPCFLVPVEKVPLYWEDSIGSILKYTGKTNETFTKMMICMAGALSDFDPLERLFLLDPIAGKGTTLFEGVCLGYDTAGIEIGDKVTGEAYHFFKRYLETEKLKHTAKTQRVSGPGKSFTAVRYTFEFARSKEEYREEAGRRQLELVAGNSQYAASLFRKNSFHLLVGDLPYGVQHGNVTGEKQSSLTRSPSQLLRACLPGWHTVLKKGGVLALAWNLFVFPREEMIRLLADFGFSPFTGGVFDGFAHRVDQAIQRDVILAKKEG